MTTQAHTGTTAAASVYASGSGKVNTSQYVADLGAFAGPMATAASTITITPNGASGLTVNAAVGDTQPTLTDKMKVALAGSGINVITDGTKVYLMSSSNFAAANAAGTQTLGFANLEAGESATVAAPTASADPTSNAMGAITAITTAVTNLGNVQGKVGTGQNRLTYAIQLAQSQITSFSAAESRIRDADVASEAANLTKAQVLQQASLAALAQANSAPQAVLSLLRG